MEVLSESATPGTAVAKNGMVEWRFALSVTAELRSSTGVTIWRESDGHYEFRHYEKPGDEAAAWADNGFSDWLTVAVGNRVAYRMLSDR